MRFIGQISAQVIEITAQVIEKNAQVIEKHTKRNNTLLSFQKLKNIMGL
jgi:hypothetical protein